MDITKERLEWLREMCEAAAKEVERAKLEMAEAKRKYDEYVDSQHTWDLAYRDARNRLGIKNNEEKPQAQLQNVLAPHVREKLRPQSIPSLAAGFLLKQIQATAEQIHEMILQRGKKVSLVSVNSSLHRYRPEIFEIYTDGTWGLVESAVIQKETAPQGT